MTIAHDVYLEGSADEQVELSKKLAISVSETVEQIAYYFEDGSLLVYLKDFSKLY